VTRCAALHVTRHAVTSRPMSAMEHEPRSTNDGDHENARQNHQKKRNMSGSAPLHRFARPIILGSHRTTVSMSALAPWIAPNRTSIGVWTVLGFTAVSLCVDEQSPEAIQQSDSIYHPSGRVFLISPAPLPSRPCDRRAQTIGRRFCIAIAHSLQDRAPRDRSPAKFPIRQR
jgi:hypothetical protein